MGLFAIVVAWLMVTHNKRRLAASTAGIVCAILLMFTQIGFLNAMLDSATELIRVLDADLVLTSKLKFSLVSTAGFPRGRLYQALAVDGVTQADPLYIELESSWWKNSRTGTTRPIRVLAFDPDHPIFGLPDVERSREALKMPDAVLMDAKSRTLYGDLATGATTELAHRVIRIVGVFSLGTDLANDGNVIMSERTFGRFFPHRRSPEGDIKAVELGIVRLAPGADPVYVQRALRRALPPDVLVLTKQEFMRQERAYWQDNTPIGFIFGLGTMVGFLIGVMICYQILFTDITDHLPQFGTVKAIGYTNLFLAGLVLQEALLLSLLAFGPGLASSLVLYWWLARLTGLPMQLTLGRVGVIFALTLAMTTLSALVAARKAMATDPAEVFG